VRNWPYPDLSVVEVGGGKISYAIQGARDGPLILYLHGWGDDFASSCL